MKISVIIPIYNGARYIEQAVQSVLNQPFQNIEIICVDDGSTDNGHEIITAMQNNSDRIMVINKKNGGVGSARNAGLDEASGEYVAFLDQDDIWLNALTKSIMMSIETESCDMVAFSYYCSNQSISRFKLEARTDSMVFRPINSIPMYHHSSYLYKRDFLKSNKIYTDRYKGIDYNYRNEDVRFLIQCYAKAKNIQCFSKTLFVYRNNPCSVVHSYQGVKTLVSCLEGYSILAENTNCQEIRETCYFYLTSLFLELMDYLSMEDAPQRKALVYYERYGIDNMIEAGFVSELSSKQYSLWRDNPQRFWHQKKIKTLKQQAQVVLGKNPILRNLYHRKKYPIQYNGDFINILYDKSSFPHS